MPSIRTLIPPIDPTNDSETRLQTRISLNDKRAVLSAIGDDGAFEFVVATTFRRVADFIRTNDLSCTSPADFTRVVEFVRNGTDTRPNRIAAAFDDTGTATRLQHSDAATAGKPSSVGAGSAAGTRKQVKVREGQGRSGGRQS